MNVLQAVLLAVVAAALGGLLATLVVRVRNHRGDDDTDLTMAQILDRVVYGTSTGVAVVDKFHDVILFNPRAVELGLVDRRLLVEQAWAAANLVLDQGDPVQIDMVRKNPHGRDRVAVRCVARRLFDDDPRFVVLYAHDDSEHVRMEATRRDFVANVSHELKTPVGAMALLAEALLESADDPDSVQYFGQRVQREATRLGNLVTELIALSRLQGAEKLPDLDVVDVDDIVADALERTRLTAENARIEITADRPSGYEVLGDRTLLVTALTNLIDNAIAYSPPDTPVSVSRSLRDGKIAIAVTDRGIGIEKQYQERVFERFFRIDKARSRATGGTGLGLAIVKHVAANHDGEIAVWSKPGTGSTFTLMIPAHLGSDADAMSSHRESPVGP